MLIRQLTRWAFVAAVAVSLGAQVRAEAPAGYPFARETRNPTALDRYVAKPDANYSWKLVRTDKEAGVTSYTIDLASQQWRTEKEVDHPIWKHWVTISVPDEVAFPTAMLFIDGGSNREGGNPPGADGDMKRLAQQTKTVTASVLMIPNQPLVFADAFGFGRSEDAMIAYTWDKFYRTGDEEWPARLPMTKAVVRAMDTIQAFVASPEGGAHQVHDFVVAGGSKRGWTTWTTAMVDTRVRAIIPCVIDLLNVVKSFRHHFSALGAWSVAIGDYQSLGILNWLNTPENEALMKIIDPIYHLDRLKMPKLLINAGNDQFFVPDSSQFYWDDLLGPKWLRYMPNVGHGLDREEAFRSLASFYHSVVADLPIPGYSFNIAEDGTITAKVEAASNGKTIKPTGVKLWQAHNPKGRDFRGFKAPYTDTVISESAPGVYTAKVDAPAEGFTAYFIELTFDGPTAETPFKFTSGVRVAPNTYTTAYTPPANEPKGFITGK